ncbi:MAG: hypothetical protein WEE51_13705 [Pirellulaceae bacterium]
MIRLLPLVCCVWAIGMVGTGVGQNWQASMFEDPPIPRVTSPQFIPVVNQRDQGNLRLPNPTEPIPQETPVPRASSPDDIQLRPLDEELWLHGGSYLYAPEGDRLGWPDQHEQTAPYMKLRIPEDHRDPQPVTLFTDFLGADPIRQWDLRWLTPEGYNWEPRFVLYGGYEMNAIALRENGQRRDGLGHQLLVDMDLRLTGTERFHAQFRPLGEGGTGGSFYQFSEPSGYIDNSTAEPQNYWFEGELHSILGSWFDPLASLDVHMVGGKFPFALHNRLLMNDEVIGFAVNKNTIYLGNTSNLNVQYLHAAADVDNVADAESRLNGVHVSLDHRRNFYEMSYFHVETPNAPGRDQHFAAFSRTSFHGPLTLAGRAMFKFGDEAGTGDGQLFVLESNYVRVLDHQPLGIESAVFYCNSFASLGGWNSISGGNFNRLRAAFDVNPLVAISTGRNLGENYGASLGVQLLRLHEDESFSPEIAYESPDGNSVWGLGLRYQRKTSKRSFFEVLGVVNFSEVEELRRDGVFVSQTILF